jgi:hypothetical protein
VRTQNLGWCAGKFVYARGSSRPIHFLDMRDFQLEPSFEISAIVALRMSRLVGRADLLEIIDVANWIDRMGVQVLAAAVVAILASLSRDLPLKIFDLSPGLGLFFEALKFECVKSEVQPLFDYVALGPSARQRSFQMLHGHDTVPFEYATASASTADIAVLNHNQILRSSDPLPSLSEAIQAAPALVAALRVGTAAKLAPVTTVTRREVTLSTLDEALAALCAKDKWGLYRIDTRLDNGLFLPDPEHGLTTAMLFTALPGQEMGLAGFKPFARTL